MSDGPSGGYHTVARCCSSILTMGAGRQIEAERTLDVREAAKLVGRHPETVRRWVWSGRLAARREGNRLLVSRADVLAAGAPNQTALTLAAWGERARAVRQAGGGKGPGKSAADLVLGDRAERAQGPEIRAGR